MIYGDLSTAGRIYMYYKGPMRVVLSDMSAGFRNQPGLEAETALRIVLHPKSWTEVDFSLIRAKYQTGSSQLNYLEKDGYLDIYTDPKEVERVKDCMAKGIDPHNKVPNASVADGFVMPQQKKYFDMSDFPKPTPVMDENFTTSVPANEVVKDINNVSTDTTAMKNVIDLMKQQMEQQAKQVDQLTEMVKSSQNLMAEMLKSIRQKE